MKIALFNILRIQAACFVVYGFTPAAGEADTTLTFDLLEFENLALEKHPQLREEALDIKEAQLQLRELERNAVLPKLQLDMAMGPAPGIQSTRDTNYLFSNGGPIETRWIFEEHRQFDLANWGPFFGMELEGVQPLNVHRYRAGHRAAVLGVEVARRDLYKEKMDVSREVQQIYHGFLFASKMLGEVERAERDLTDAEEKLQEMLDEDYPGVSQEDLLKLRLVWFDITKGHGKAKTGYRQAHMGVHFYLGLPSDVSYSLADTVPYANRLALPPLDSLKMWALKHHPDLERLEKGLAARRELLKVAKGEMGPDLFLFGRFKYTKAWSSERGSAGPDAFARDPLNELDGAFGLGMRLRLNFWNRYQNFKKARLELRRLQRKEVYAVRGLLLRLEEAWVKYEGAEANLRAADLSLRSAEALLKGAAMAYDLDPSLAREMVEPYKSALLAKEDYFQTIYDFNLALADLIHAVGFTYGNFLEKLNEG